MYRLSAFGTVPFNLAVQQSRHLPLLPAAMQSDRAAEPSDSGGGGAQADWIIYVTDSGQADHFRLVFASARRAGILPSEESQTPRVSHVGFGLVLGDDGKRFRTRSSEVPPPPSSTTPGVEKSFPCSFHDREMLVLTSNEFIDSHRYIFVLIYIHIDYRGELRVSCTPAIA